MELHDLAQAFKNLTGYFCAAPWLPPSLESRVAHVLTWVGRFLRLCPITAASQELVKFDLQKIEDPEISGVASQQGTLAGYELREYLLEKWHRTCAYCGKTDVPLQVEHIHPKSRGGSDRVSNLTLACEPCNRRKGNRPVEVFLKKKPEVLERIRAQAKAPLKDATAVNATRWDLSRRLQATGLPVECGSGGRTKFNRTTQGLPKRHWLDAACVGASTPEHLGVEGIRPLLVKACGHGKRNRCGTDAYGFPIRHAAERSSRRVSALAISSGPTSRKGSTKGSTPAGLRFGSARTSNSGRCRFIPGTAERSTVPTDMHIRSVEPS